jgi:NADPH:quinone reductase-like Zn-dependent oxidoreductase
LIELVLRENSQLQIEQAAVPVLAENQALVKIHFAALNHRDEWIRKGQYAKIQLPSILGSDGSGVVEKVANDADAAWVGKEVIINPNQNWGDNPKAQSKAYNILGMPAQGTLAEYVAVNVDRLAAKPQHLTLEQSAALPLGGLTAFNATFNKAQVKDNEHILISGVGGGVAQFAFLFAAAAKANVYVTSSKQEVVDACKTLGAKGGCSYKDADALKKMAAEAGGFDAIIDSACGDGMNLLLSLLKPAGRFAFYGATQGLPSNLNMRNIFWNHLQLLGSTMGSDIDFVNMVQFIEHNNIQPIIDKTFALDEAVQAFDRMHKGEQFGKIIIKIVEN